MEEKPSFIAFLCGSESINLVGKTAVSRFTLTSVLTKGSPSSHNITHLCD